MRFQIRVTPDAETDLEGIRAYIGEKASTVVAEGYLSRMLAFIGRLEHFPERGSLRNDIMPGLRIMGFERRVAIAFRVEGDEVIVMRVLYGGRQLDI